MQTIAIKQGWRNLHIFVEFLILIKPNFKETNTYECQRKPIKWKNQTKREGWDHTLRNNSGVILQAKFEDQTKPNFKKPLNKSKEETYSN